MGLAAWNWTEGPDQGCPALVLGIEALSRKVEAGLEKTCERSNLFWSEKVAGCVIVIKGYWQQCWHGHCIIMSLQHVISCFKELASCYQLRLRAKSAVILNDSSAKFFCTAFATRTSYNTNLFAHESWGWFRVSRLSFGGSFCHLACLPVCKPLRDTTKKQTEIHILVLRQ